MSDHDLVPGLLAAADLCEEFVRVNTAAAHDEIQIICQRPDWHHSSLHDVAHTHACKANAAYDIAAFLRHKAVVIMEGEEEE